MRCILTFTAKASLHTEHRLIRMADTGPETPKAADGTTPLSGRIQDYLKDMKDDQNNGLMEKMILEKLKTEGVVSSDKEIQELMQVAESAFLRLESLQHLTLAQHRVFVAGLMAQFPRDNDALLRMATANGFLDPAAMARAINDSKNFHSYEDPSEQSGAESGEAYIPGSVSPEQMKNLKPEQLTQEINLARKDILRMNGRRVALAQDFARQSRGRPSPALRSALMGQYAMLNDEFNSPSERYKAAREAWEAKTGQNYVVFEKQQKLSDWQRRQMEQDQGDVNDTITGVRRRRDQLDDDEEIVGGVRRRKARPRDRTEAQRIADGMRANDFVDNGQIPMYEYRVPSTFKPSPRRGADGQMQEVNMDEWMSYQPGTDGRSVSRGSNNRHPRRDPTLSVPSLFGGSINDKAYNKAKGRPVFDQNGPNGNKALSRRFEGPRFAEASKLYAELYKKYSKEKIEGALSYNQLELLMNKAVDSGERLQHSKDLIQAIKVIDRELSSVGSLENATAIETIPEKTKSISFAMNFQEDRPENIHEEIVVADAVNKKYYRFRPQFLHDTTKGAADIKAIKDMAKAGIVVKIERNGVNIPYSTMKYVSGMTIGLAKNTVGYVSVNRSILKKEEKEATIDNVPSIPFSLAFAGPDENAETATEEGYVAPETPSQTVLKIPSNEKVPYINEAKAREHAERRDALLKKVEQLDSDANANVKIWFKKALSFEVGKAADNQFFLFYRDSASSVELLVNDAEKSQIISGFINNPADPSSDYKNICNILKTPNGALDGLEKNLEERLHDQEKQKTQKQIDELIATFEKVQTVEQFDGLKKVLSEAKDSLIESAKTRGVTQSKIDTFIKDFDDRALPFQPGNPIIQKPHPGHGRKFNAWTLEQLLKTLKVHGDIFNQESGTPGIPLNPQTDA